MPRNLANDAENPDLSSLSDNTNFVVRSGATLKEAAWSLLKSSLAGYVLASATSDLFAPADATTYYFGAPMSMNPKTTSAQRKVYIPKAGKITRVDLYVHNNSGVVGSNEISTISLRLNDTTDIPLTTTLTADAASGETRYFNITGLSTAVVAGDFYEIKWVTPTWVTNPTNVVIEVRVYVESQ